MPNFVMMGGLPGSGKDYYIDMMLPEHNVHSSDRIRKEWYGDESIQGDNNKIFRELHNRIINDLKNGYDVVYNATNINSKKRVGFLKDIKNLSCEKECIIVATPYIQCIAQNATRKRHVPPDVIQRMYCSWNMPNYFEGWDRITIHYNMDTVYFSGYYSMLSEMKGFNQDNSHHTLDLYSHCYACREFLRDRTDNYLLLEAGFLHDVGKLYTKSFVDSKGNETSDAHYYSHDSVGAYEAMFMLFNRYTESSIIDICSMINYHMYPYFWKEEKTKEKYKNLWGENFYNSVMLLHEADKSAK